MPADEKQLSFIEHLEELRKHLLICCAALLICSIAGFFLSRPVIEFLLKPLRNAQKIQQEKVLNIIVDESGNLKLEKNKDEIFNNPKARFSFFRLIDKNNPDKQIMIGSEYGSNFYYFSPMTPFFLQFKAAFLIGFLIAIPIILHQMWLFISPALTDIERKASSWIILAALILFPTGAFFAYYILKYTLYFLISFSFEGLEPRIDVMKYLSFAMTMMLAMGCVFEFPIVAVFLGKIGLITSAKMRAARKYAIVFIVIFAAVATPGPDPVSQTFVAIPLIILYEISIYLVKMVERKAEDAENTDPYTDYAG